MVTPPPAQLSMPLWVTGEAAAHVASALALPVLDSMIPALSAVANTAAAPVKRLGVFYVPNGMSMPYWFPKSEGPLTDMPATLQVGANIYTDGVPDIVARFEGLTVEPLAPGAAC